MTESWRGTCEPPPPGELALVETPFGPVCLANVGGEVHAFDDACPHGACSLFDEGVLDGATLECQCHFASYDVVSGDVVAEPAEEPLVKYAVALEDGEIVLTSAGPPLSPV